MFLSIPVGSAGLASYPHLSTACVARKKRCIDIHPVVSTCSSFVPGELGEDMSRRKLTVEQVLEARLRCRAGERDLSKLAREFGVTRQVLQSAIVGHTFKDLPMPPKRMR